MTRFKNKTLYKVLLKLYPFGKGFCCPFVKVQSLFAKGFKILLARIMDPFGKGPVNPFGKDPFGKGPMNPFGKGPVNPFGKDH